MKTSAKLASFAYDDQAREWKIGLEPDSGVFLTHTVLPGVGGVPARYVLRMAIGATHTQERHVRACWEALQRLAVL